MEDKFKNHLGTLCGFPLVKAPVEFGGGEYVITNPILLRPLFELPTPLLGESHYANVVEGDSHYHSVLLDRCRALTQALWAPPAQRGDEQEENDRKRHTGDFA